MRGAKRHAITLQMLSQRSHPDTSNLDHFYSDCLNGLALLKSLHSLATRRLISHICDVKAIDIGLSRLLLYMTNSGNLFLRDSTDFLPSVI